MNEIKMSSLVDRINAEHAACIAAAQDAIGRAIEVGRLLAEAKSGVRHGEWADWVRANCAFGIREAQRYIRVHRNAGEIEQKRHAVSHLSSLRGALDVLDPPVFVDEDEERRPSYRPMCECSPQERRQHCHLWWDQRAAHALMLDAAGWDAGKIAEYLGQPVEHIEAILDPRLPVRFDTEANGSWLAAGEPGLSARYANNVEAMVARSLARAHESAARICGAEGYGAVRPILDAGFRRHHRRSEAAEARGVWPHEPISDDSETNDVLWCLAIGDGRWAIRCGAETEGRPEAPMLTELFEEQIEACRSRADV